MAALEEEGEGTTEGGGRGMGGGSRRLTTLGDEEGDEGDEGEEKDGGGKGTAG